MRELKTIEAKYISRSDSRPIDKATVEKLSESIKEIGLLQPITVKQATVMISGVAGDGYKVVAGNHRLEALKSSGILDIEAFVLRDLSWADSELREIDENLIRAELTPSQRAHAIRRRKELWTQRHPQAEEMGGQALATHPDTDSSGRRRTEQQSKQFASETAERTGQSKSSINSSISRADALGDDLDAVTGTSLDKGVELDALKGMSPEERAPLIERARAGEQVSARKGGDGPRKYRISPVTQAKSILSDYSRDDAMEIARLIISGLGHELEDMQ